MKPRLWVVSELYYPETASTAHYMTSIAEALTKDFEVKVLSVQPTYLHRGVLASKCEIRNGVEVFRSSSTTFDKNKLAGRLLNLFSISAVLVIASMRRIRRGDVAFVVSNPPPLPFLVQIVCMLKGVDCVVRVDDVYSELMVVSGFLRRSGFKYKVMARCSGWLFRVAKCVIVLGRDMHQLVVSRARGVGGKIHIIPNWADCDEVVPLPRDGNAILKELGLGGKFIVQCAGNLGRVQAIESLVEAAKLLKSEARIHFLFIGTGAKRAWLEEQQSRFDLANVTMLGPRPRSEQTVFLNACDIGTTALTKGMYGAAVPSRLYNVMAAGKPVLVIGEHGSEAALVVEEERIGWVAHPDNPAAIAKIILEASRSPALLAEFGRRARTAAAEKYGRDAILARYTAVFARLKLATSAKLNSST